jgi:L-ribulose-5-phosphate 4-epimerase
MGVDAEIGDVVQRIRREVADLHDHLPRNSLVVWTAGNVSARVPGRDLLVIKPSGVGYEELSADSMVVTDFEANLVEGGYAPSSDTAAHGYVYKTYAGGWWGGAYPFDVCDCVGGSG